MNPADEIATNYDAVSAAPDSDSETQDPYRGVPLGVEGAWWPTAALALNTAL
ncbi:MAG: hypothetical protein JOZ85_08665 [Betaproteobacteria bacterium]|nr:hypothetical protein [Betaproteobacteria bacterium]